MSDDYEVQPVLTALENERRYVARELHDGLAQTTQQLGLQAGICRKLLERNNWEMLDQELATMAHRIEQASTQVREMINDMRPPLVEGEHNLSNYLAYALEIHAERGGPPVEQQLEIAPDDLSLSRIEALGMIRIIQEALLNVRKHAQAEQVRLTLTEDEQKLHLTIADDGVGFDLAKVRARSGEEGRAGLANLRARAIALGGSFTVHRDDESGWTEIRVTLPK